VFDLNGGDSRVNVSGGAWRVVNYYDANNSVRQYPSSTTNADYRVLLSNGANDNDETNLTRKDTNFKYNPSTNTLTVGKIANTAVSDFTSGDSTDANATAWTSVTKVDDNTAFGTFFNRVSTMMKNVRYLYKMLGTTDVSSFFGGSNQTVTSALSTLNSHIGSHTVAKDVPSNAVFTDTNTWRPCVNALNSTATDQSLSAAQGKALNDRLTPIGGNYVTNYTVLATSYTAGTKVKVVSFQVTKAGTYLWSPHFRSTLSRDGYMSAMISGNATPTYSIGAYSGSVTQTGMGGNVVACMSGMTLIELAANTTYYIWFESNVSGSGVNTFNWTNLMLIKPS
jgi:hypothetical protein